MTFIFVTVPSLTNGLTKEVEEINPTQDYFIKCPQCQKGCQSFQSLKEHMEISHSDITSVENGTVNTPNVASPSPGVIGTGGPFGCSQCATSFPSKDQLEKHELLHSPNAQVVSYSLNWSMLKCCVKCRRFLLINVLYLRVLCLHGYLVKCLTSSNEEVIVLKSTGSTKMLT